MRSRLSRIHCLASNRPLCFVPTVSSRSNSSKQSQTTPDKFISSTRTHRLSDDKAFERVQYFGTSRAINAASRPQSISTTTSRRHHVRRPLVDLCPCNCFSTTSSSVTLTRRPAPHTGRISILTLDNPRTLNALSQATLASLNEHICDIRDEQAGPDGNNPPTRVLILASAVPRAFCSGADLKERREFTSQETATFLAHLRSTFSLISALPIPTISCVSSLAFGGGLELALATNFRIFGTSASVALPESRLGIIPGAGGTWRLPQLVGKSRALEMMLTGRRVGGSEAGRIGLAERVVDCGEPSVDVENDLMRQLKRETMEDFRWRAGEKVLMEAVKWAEQMCDGAPASMREVLRCVQEDRGQDGENEAYERVVKTEDREEALRAFAEKRKAVFRGR